jgi:hypothetical protein
LLPPQSLASSAQTLPTAWQRALKPAFKAAAFGGLVGIMSVFRVQSELSPGERIIASLISSAVVGGLFFAAVYLVAALIYASKRS